MGHLVSTEVCKNGKTFGSVVIYYQNGQPKYKTVLHGNTHVDTTRLYYPNGELKQLIVYGAHGRKVDFGVWQPNGELDPSYIHPLLFSDTDTVQEGQDYAFEIVLGNRRSNVVDVKLLTPTKGLDSTRGTYANRRYLIRQPTLGQHMVKAEVREQWARKGSDTIWTNYYSVNHRFSVIGVLAKQNNSIE